MASPRSIVDLYTPCVSVVERFLYNNIIIDVLSIKRGNDLAP